MMNTALSHGAPTLKSPLGIPMPRTPAFTREGILGSAHKARTMSAGQDSRPALSLQSAGISHDLDSALLGSIAETLSKGNLPAGSNNACSSDDGGTGANPLKRKNSDMAGGPIDYPRRRATIACEVCRSRKSRCDGGKPKCKLCTELGAECIYREPGVKLDAGDKLILERLGRIESLLQMQLINNPQSAPNGHLGQTSSSISSANGGFPSDALNGLLSGNSIHNSLNISVPGLSLNPALSIPSAATSGLGQNFPSTGLGTWPSSIPTLSTMPKIHTNAALHLLQWPLIRQLVSQPYDPQILLQLEMDREPLHSLTKTPCVDLANTQAYMEAYFAHVNVWYACVNPYTWRSHYRIALSNGFREGPESCIVLLVLALGQASLRGSISRVVPQEDPPGLQYFTAAWALLPGMLTTNSVLAVQCHLLAAAYLFYLVRPLEAWNLLCSTSTKLQLLLMSPGRIPPTQRELTERIYWNTLLFESDLLAELDLPHSGIVQFEDHVGLPGGFEPTDDIPSSAPTSTPSNVATAPSSDPIPAPRDSLWYFLAEIALRRLLNRVSQTLYTKDHFATAASLSSLEPVVAELDFQLSQWYESLPVPLQFPFGRTPVNDAVQTVLRLRFFACRTIIYRPYVLAILENEGSAMESVVRENGMKCLEAAVRQLENITAHHDGHMPYLWQGALSVVSQTLLIMGATMSPSLMELLLTIVPQREAINQIIHDVVIEIERYAVLAPSLALAAEILREAEMRRRAHLGI